MLRLFIISLLLNVIIAIPQGYNYQKEQQTQQLINNSLLPQTTYSQKQQQQQNLTPPAPVITKDYYIHSAPDDLDDDNSLDNNSEPLPVHKHYRVIFIKAPSQAKLAAQALKLAQAQNEEKTVIYVLSKKTDLADIQNQLVKQTSQSQISKPEVFFIKYKTQEEARHAQQQIQAQYDSLGGTSSVSDEGFAPVSSVIGSLANKPAAFSLPNSNGGTLSSSSSPSSSSLSLGISSQQPAQLDNNGNNNQYVQLEKVISPNLSYLPTNRFRFLI